MRRFMTYLILCLLAVFLVPSLAAASAVDPPPSTHLALPTDQIWAFVAGNLAPLAAYFLNYRAPWLSESVKGVVQIVVAAVAAGLAQAITAGDVGFNDTTLQFIITGVVGALLAHKWFWQPSAISTKVGGGRNIQDDPSR